MNSTTYFAPKAPYIPWEGGGGGGVEGWYTVPTIFRLSLRAQDRAAGWRWIMNNWNLYFIITSRCESMARSESVCFRIDTSFGARKWMLCIVWPVDRPCSASELETRLLKTPIFVLNGSVRTRKQTLIQADAHKFFFFFFFLHEKIIIKQMGAFVYWAIGNDVCQSAHNKIIRKKKNKIHANCCRWLCRSKRYRRGCVSVSMSFWWHSSVCALLLTDNHEFMNTAKHLFTPHHLTDTGRHNRSFDISYILIFFAPIVFSASPFFCSLPLSILVFDSDI